MNKMAHDGWRLIKTTQLTYDFEPCIPDEYEYRIEFIAQMSLPKSEKYRNFLKDIGYDVLYKNLNLNWNTGKIRWRPFGKGMGQFSTYPGTFNRELLIVGKKKMESRLNFTAPMQIKRNILKSSEMRGFRPPYYFWRWPFCDMFQNQ